MNPLWHSFDVLQASANPPTLRPERVLNFQTEFKSGQYAFSNDGPIPPEILEEVTGLKDGIALHIGSGATFSLLDQHNLQPVVVDHDQAVIKMMRLIHHAIVNTDTIEEVRTRIAKRGSKIISKSPAETTVSLDNEASPYMLGNIHWTNRFEQVRSALRERPPIYVVADISDPRVVSSMQRTAKVYGPIKLFVATNVHNHLTHRMQTMDFLHEMPFSAEPEPIIMYSDNRDACRYEGKGKSIFIINRKVAFGLSPYLSDTKRYMASYRSWSGPLASIPIDTSQ